MPSKLEQLRAMTVVVADTGDLDAVRRLKPQDCTTNPTLLLKAVENPGLRAHASKRRLSLGQRPGRLARGRGVRHLRSARGGLRRRARRDRAGPRVDRGGCGSVLRHRGDRSKKPARIDPRLRGARHRPRAHPDQDRVDLGGHPRRRDPSEGRHRLQPHAPVLPSPGTGLRGGRRVSDFALRRPNSRLAREGRRRALHGRDRSRRRSPCATSTPPTRRKGSRPS